MRVYQPKTPVHFAEAALSYYPFKKFYGSGRPLDLQQLLDSLRRLTSTIEYPPVHAFRKKVEIRKMRQHLIAAVLLMASERHLPGWESEERKALRAQIQPHPAHELLLVLYVLYNIVADYQVKLSLQFLDRKYIRSHKTALHTFFCKKTLSSLYFPLRHIHTKNPAACLSKRQQIAALAATYLQNIDAPAYPHI